MPFHQETCSCCTPFHNRLAYIYFSIANGWHKQGLCIPLPLSQLATGAQKYHWFCHLDASIDLIMPFWHKYATNSFTASWPKLTRSVEVFLRILSAWKTDSVVHNMVWIGKSQLKKTGLGTDMALAFTNSFVRTNEFYLTMTCTKKAKTEPKQDITCSFKGHSINPKAKQFMQPHTGLQCKELGRYMHLMAKELSGLARHNK
jgi:hypothetical protein